jgi:hypothetical protein
MKRKTLKRVLGASLLLALTAFAGAGCTRAISDSDFQKVVVWIEDNGTYQSSSQAYYFTLPSSTQDFQIGICYFQQTEKIRVLSVKPTNVGYCVFVYWTVGYQRSTGEIYYVTQASDISNESNSTLVDVDFTVSKHLVDTSATNTYTVSRNPLKVEDRLFRQDSGSMPAASLNPVENYLASQSVPYIL